MEVNGIRISPSSNSSNTQSNKAKTRHHCLPLSGIGFFPRFIDGNTRTLHLPLKSLCLEAGFIKIVYLMGLTSLTRGSSDTRSLPLYWPKSRTKNLLKTTKNSLAQLKVINVLKMNQANGPIFQNV